MRNLFFERNYWLSVPGREGTVIAIYAAADTLAAVSVGACKTGVHIDLADPAAKTAPQVMAIGIDA